MPAGVCATVPQPECPPPHQGTQTEQYLLDKAISINFLFQYTREELEGDVKERFLTDFDESTTSSFLFFAVDLKKNDYSRTDYAQLTREINKRLSIPTIVLFRVKEDIKTRITIGFVGRRASKADESRDVLEKVSLLRDIKCHEPHAGHREILKELHLDSRLKYIASNKSTANFDDLMDSLLDELDTEALNRRFYEDLSKWFHRAKEEIQFPDDMEKKEDWIIRLITRLLFVWFIKEKGLVSEDLFNCHQMKKYLKKPSSHDAWYRVVLQNLFFATLNTPINERRFGNAANDDQSNYSVRKYRHQIADGYESKLLALFNKTPFINGGLFECLDNFGATEGSRKKIDYYSDTYGSELSVSNTLFFDSKGLVTIFRKYKFTIEESTPIEQDIALDPELLGQVFEKLLGEYSSEVDISQRKRMGSYYTPRKIVDYMVQESLAEYLATKTGIGKSQLTELLDYSASRHQIPSGQIRPLVEEISNLKILDPAVGSGAFPVSALHHLTLTLSRLDPCNKIWQSLQKQLAVQEAAGAFDEDDQPNRDGRLQEISDSFSRYSTNYGRKLFLIQNSIYGVDIHPVACQIAKLRFFISLAIEQTLVDDKDNNLNIKPLPNLETKIVAADALVGIKRQESLKSSESLRLINELSKNRSSYFNAVTRSRKESIQARDRNIRKDLADALRKDDLHDDASMIVNWDAYSQNSFAKWFEPEYMFGISDGFDIVFGNPPYVKSEYILNERPYNFPATTKPALLSEYEWIDDLYVHFIHKGLDLVRNNGILSYITNDSFIRFKNKERVRNLFLNYKIRSLVKCPPETFDATIYVAIIVVLKQKSKSNEEYEYGEITHPKYEYRYLQNIAYRDVYLFDQLSPPDAIISALYIRLVNQFRIVDDSLHILDIGINSGNVRHKIFFINNPDKKLNRLIQGKQISRYYLNWDSPSAKYKFCDIDYVPLPIPGIGRGGKPSKHNEYWTFQGNKRDYHHFSERLLIRQTSDSIVVAYHNKERSGQFYTDNTLFTVLPKIKDIDIRYAMTILNSRVTNALYQSISQEKGKALAQVKVGKIRKLPLPVPSKSEQDVFIKLAEDVMKAKEQDPKADTSGLEAEIDKLVYDLYGLTQEERKIVDNAVS